MFSPKYLFTIFAFCFVSTNSLFAGEQAGKPKGYSIPLIDLAGETHRQIIVDKEPGQYLGHPTTVLLEDNKTIITVYPKGHGRGAIVMKKSTDGGLSWVKIKTVNWDGQFSFVDEKTGWAVATDGEEIALVFTQDGGHNWQLILPAIK